MKVTYTTKSGVTIEAEGSTMVEVWRQLATMTEVFATRSRCGMSDCQSDDIYFNRRTPEKNGKRYEYFELRCRKCFARFSMGQHQEGGTLFPKWKGDDGNPLPDGGWSRYQSDDGSASQSNHDPRLDQIREAIKVAIAGGVAKDEIMAVLRVFGGADRVSAIPESQRGEAIEVFTGMGPTF